MKLAIIAYDLQDLRGHLRRTYLSAYVNRRAIARIETLWRWTQLAMKRNDPEDLFQLETCMEVYNGWIRRPGSPPDGITRPIDC